MERRTRFRCQRAEDVGWLEQFGLDAVALEFNCNWIAGRKDYAVGWHWETFGEKLPEVFFQHFGAMPP